MLGISSTNDVLKLDDFDKVDYQVCDRSNRSVEHLRRTPENGAAIGSLKDDTTANRPEPRYIDLDQVIGGVKTEDLVIVWVYHLDLVGRD